MNIKHLLELRHCGGLYAKKEGKKQKRRGNRVCSLPSWSLGSNRESGERVGTERRKLWGSLEENGVRTDLAWGFTKAGILKISVDSVQSVKDRETVSPKWDDFIIPFSLRPRSLCRRGGRRIVRGRGDGGL